MFRSMNRTTPVQSRYPEPTRQSFGRLTVDVLANEGALPVENAVIRVTRTDPTRQPETVEELITNVSGQTAEINLPAPPLDLTLEPSPEKPYSEYTLEVTAPGYERVLIEGVQIFANTTAIQNVEVANPLAPPMRQMEQVIRIQPHTLWGTYPPKIPEDPVKPEPPATGFVVLDQPVIPEFIIVHDGVPDDTTAPNYWIPFRDYIKNVASSEIYATWPEATIQSNVLAILSFTLNRVFTEWYRGKGKNFTITSSTAYDHAFFYGRNIYENISQIVDDIFTNYITRPGLRQPLLTQYCDGVQVNCPTWMTQWGSKNLGDQGLPAIEILRRYYGQSIYLATAERVSGIPASYPGFTLQIGSSGTEVRRIQSQLNRVADNFPAIPKLRVDGQYGTATRQSVEEFQRIFHLPPTGVVDFATWYRISDVFVAVTKMAELV